MGVEAELNSVKAKNEKEAQRKQHAVLLRLLQVPDEKRFRPMLPKGKRPEKKA